MTRYIIRLDDFSRYSDFKIWDEITEFCRNYKIRCLIGVIPDCKDLKLDRGWMNTDKNFWTKVLSFRDMDLAIHGLHHEIFSNMSYTGQFNVLAKAQKEFLKRKISPDIFIAPKHKYNDDTIEVLKNFGISILSDGRGLFVEERNEVILVPQIFGKPRKFPLGTITICLHPDTMTNSDIYNLKCFIVDNKNNIISIKDAVFEPLSVFNYPFKRIVSGLRKIKYIMRMWKKDA